MRRASKPPRIRHAPINGDLLYLQEIVMRNPKKYFVDFMVASVCLDPHCIVQHIMKK